jgi:Tol biopolymer transport system component
MKRKGWLLFMLGLVFLIQAGGVAWSQVTERLSVDSVGVEGNNASTAPSNSSDGRYVAFESKADNLVAGDGNGTTSDVFVHDRQTGDTTRVSLHTDGTEGNFESKSPSISSDGRYIAFESFADSLVDDDTNSFWDIFVHDLQTRTTTRVSLHTDSTEGDGPSFAPSISGDGRYVAFVSDADNLVLPDTDNGLYYDIFVHDLQTGTTRVSDGLAGIQGNGHSYSPSISADGRYVAFESFANNLVAGDGNLTADVFVHDRQTKDTTRVSLHTDGTEGNLESNSPSISGDGRYVAFVSDATNLVAGDLNGLFDVFVHDRDADGDGIYDEAGAISTVRVSVRSDGTEADQASAAPSISGDGRYVAFESDATNLVAGDGNGSTDVFVHDLQTGATTRVSVDLDGVEGNGTSNNPSMSADGSSVTFESVADNLVAGDTNTAPDIFADDLQAGAGEDEGGGDGNSGGGGGCFIATAADGSGMAGELK